MATGGFVAQLVRALPCHGRGREFESRRIRHQSTVLWTVFWWCLRSYRKRPATKAPSSGRFFGGVSGAKVNRSAIEKGLYFSDRGGIIVRNMAIKVTRKDQNEANENIIRRFNRKVLQSGVMPLKKSQMRFSKPISKRERRLKAIIREARKAEKTERIKLGLK